MSRRPTTSIPIDEWDETDTVTVPDQPRMVDLVPLPRERTPRHTPVTIDDEDERTAVRIRLRTSRTLLAVIWD